MWCDFFIDIFLKIQYKNNTFSLIHISKKNGYFCDFYLFIDNDNEIDFLDKLYNHNKLLVLETKNPTLIYEKNNFINSKYRNIYKNIIINHISNFEDIYNIYELEIRTLNDEK